MKTRDLHVPYPRLHLDGNGSLGSICWNFYDAEFSARNNGAKWNVNCLRSSVGRAGK